MRDEAFGVGVSTKIKLPLQPIEVDGKEVHALAGHGGKEIRATDAGDLHGALLGHDAPLVSVDRRNQTNLAADFLRRVAQGGKDVLGKSKGDRRHRGLPRTKGPSIL
jgi:hypothetical protein